MKKIEYEISVTNSGNLTVKNIEVNDELTGDKWTVKGISAWANKLKLLEHLIL